MLYIIYEFNSANYKNDYNVNNSIVSSINYKFFFIPKSPYHYSTINLYYNLFLDEVGIGEESYIYV